MTLRRQKKPGLIAPNLSTTSSTIKGEDKLGSQYSSSAALTTGPAVTRHPLQSGALGEAGRKGGVESQANNEPGTGDLDDGRTRHTASEEGSERKGQEMNEQRLYGTQQLHQQLDTSCRAIGPRTSVSGALGVASGVAGSSACGTACGTSEGTKTTSRTERRLPKIILKVKRPPGAGMG